MNSINCHNRCPTYYETVLYFPFLLLWISTTALAFNPSTNTSFLVLQTNSSDCSLVINQPLSQQCQFINDNNCQSTGLINYYKLYYCRLSFLHNPSSPFLIQTLSILPLTICLILCFISVGITASEYLCPYILYLNFKITRHFSRINIISIWE